MTCSSSISRETSFHASSFPWRRDNSLVTAWGFSLVQKPSSEVIFVSFSISVDSPSGSKAFLQLGNERVKSLHYCGHGNLSHMVHLQMS